MKPGPVLCPTCSEPVGPDMQLMLDAHRSSTFVRVMLVNDGEIAAAMRDHLLAEHTVFPDEERPDLNLGLATEEVDETDGAWAAGYRSGYGAGRKGRH